MARVLKPLRQTVITATKKLGLPKDWWLVLIGAVLGSLTGLLAVGFAEVLHLTEHLVELQQETHWWMVILLPTVGMGLTGAVVHFFSSDAKGHGVPQVMEALIKRGGRMPLRTGIVKAIASILTVGSGGSAGVEGPIVQIGAVAGSVSGRTLGLDRQAIQTLVGCGAAAGIASIFNAPIAGVLFALEVLLRDFSLRTFTPIVIASVFSAVTTQAVLGENQAIFPTDTTLHAYEFSLIEMPSYIALGILCGLVAVGFSRLLHWGEDRFERLRIHPIARAVTAGAMLGVLGLGFVAAAGTMARPGEHVSPVPSIFGDGYRLINGLLDPETYIASASSDPGLPAETLDASEAGRAATGGTDTAPASPVPTLTGTANRAAHTPGESHAPRAALENIHPPPGPGIPVTVLMLAVLLVFKAIATTVTLAGGGSGGVFAPALCFGAIAGAGLGLALEHTGLTPTGSSPASYALVGMAAVVAAMMHAPLTSILMLYELTRNEYVLLPIMLAAVLATLIAQVLDRDSIYTAKLRRQGVIVGRARDHTLLRQLAVASVARTPLPPEPIYASDPLGKLIGLHANHHVPDFPVVDQDGGYLGMVTGRDIRTALIDREAIPLLLVAELMRTDIPIVDPTEQLDTVMDKFSEHDIASLCLVNHNRRPIALITRSDVMKRYQAALESDD